NPTEKEKPPCDAERHELRANAELWQKLVIFLIQQNSHSGLHRQSPSQKTGKKKPTRCRVGFQ
ncbi:hypothetical protein L6209_10200, partial [Pseudomonas syringae pv. syringae]|uniref:hypothetical protein n=1 Tax=Pseudomonas syringae TaxID=317 RepID=UPI001F100CED